MKAKDVMNALNISRQTLCNYKKKGLISVKNEINGRFEYDDESVFQLLCKNKDRKVVAYARISTKKQKTSLETQTDKIVKYCLENNISLDSVYSDIASGISLDRKDFNKLLDAIIRHEISTVIITDRDRLTRYSFNSIKALFEKFGTNVLVLSDVGIIKSEENELISDLIAMIHCFSMRMYASRKKQKLALIEEDLKLLINDNE